MQHFFLEGIRIAPGSDVDLASLHHQLWRVLRLRVKDRIILLDNKDSAFLCELTSIGAAGATGHVLERTPITSEPQLSLTLYQCLLKGDKFEWVLQKGTELGVVRFVPVFSQRVVVRSGTAVRKKYARWCTIIREAAEQCGRGRLPSLEAPVDLATAVQVVEGCRLAPWEEATGEMGLLAALRHLESNGNGVQPSSISVLIGPEGGLESKEVEMARETGWQIVTLGQRILRAETAAVATTSLIMGWAHELGGKQCMGHHV